MYCPSDSGVEYASGCGKGLSIDPGEQDESLIAVCWSRTTNDLVDGGCFRLYFDRIKWLWLLVSFHRSLVHQFDTGRCFLSVGCLKTVVPNACAVRRLTPRNESRICKLERLPVHCVRPLLLPSKLIATLSCSKQLEQGSMTLQE